MPGRKAKPAALRLLEGNRGHRPIPNEARVETDLPEPPRWLDRIARAEWRRMVGPLHAMGILTATDVTMLEAYCRIYSEWRKAESLNDQIKAVKELRLIASEFGMTPSSRAKVATGAKKEDVDPFEELVAQSG